MNINQKSYVLANPWRRLVAVIIDTALIYISLIVVGGLADNDNSNVPFTSTWLNVFIILFFLLIATQIVLLTIKGQTIGKLALGVKIIKIKTGENGGFVTNILLRTLLNFLLRIIPLYGLIDILFIFNKDYRCIHDHIAGTIVIDLKKNFACNNLHDETCEKTSELNYSEPISTYKPKSNRKPLIIVTIFVIILVILATPKIATWLKEFINVVNSEEQDKKPIVFESYDKKFSVFAPEGWTLQDQKLNLDADLIIFSEDEERGFLVVRENKKDFKDGYNIEDYWIKISEIKANENIKINRRIINGNKVSNYPAVQGDFEMTEDDLNFKYLITCVETSEYFYQLVGWTNRSKFETYQEEFIDISNSFKEKYKGNEKL